MYGMTKSDKLFDDELTEWVLEAGFIQSNYNMSIYYKYAPYGLKKLYYLMLMTMSIGIQIKLL